MVILSMTKSVSDQYECEYSEGGKEGANLVRPCERYKELHRSCKSIFSRFHQYYVYGELLDCSPHKDNYKRCLKYRSTKDETLLDPIIEWEKNLIDVRLKTVGQNKAWKLRDSPPTDFEGPLPEYIERRREESFFNSGK